MKYQALHTVTGILTLLPASPAVTAKNRFVLTAWSRPTSAYDVKNVASPPKCPLSKSNQVTTLNQLQLQWA